MINKANFYQKDDCRCCNKKNLNLVLHHKSTPIGDEFIPAKKYQETYPVDVLLCKDCGLLQLSCVVDPKLIYGDYFYTTSLSLGLVNHFENYAENVMRRVNIPKKSLVIEIGSNEGSLLKAFKNKNMRVLGVDPAVKIAEKATKSGINTIPDFFTSKLAEEIKNQYGLARIITANNVIANIDNIKNVIEGVKKLLTKDGIFVIETANALDIIKNDLLDNIYHEHVSYFSSKSLKNLFDINEMELIDIERTHMKGGSLLGIAQLKNGIHKKSSSIDELITLESSLGLYEKEIYKEFNKRMENEKNRIHDILKPLKDKGRTIAGYGASVGGTAILYNLELGEFINFIVDDYKPKHGLFSPGLHIPVLPSEEIYKRKPDCIVNFAWRYAGPIMGKHQKYLESGGKFITPFSKIGENE